MSIRRKNIWVFLLIDSLVVTLSLLGAYLLRFDFSIPKEMASNASYFLVVLIFSKLSVNVVFNVYSGLWKYTSVADLLNIIKASSAGTILSAALTLMVLGFFAIPRSIFFIDYILTTIGFVSARAAVRIYSNYFISKQKKSNLPIICIGNIVVGGAGKTPVAIKIGKILKLNGYNPHFVSKGYGGIEKNNNLVQSWHSAKSVGDESLLLSEIAPTWIGIDRNKSFKLASDNNSDCIIMDDGFQNPTLQKDFSIIVINGEQGFGNKRVMPSGPLRESITRGISRTNLVVVIGKISNDVKKKIPKNIPIIYASFKIDNQNIILKGQKITAFAGIAYPEIEKLVK